MEQPKNGRKPMKEKLLGFFPFFLIVAVEDRLDHFKVPVTELVPGELIEYTGSLIEMIRIQRFADLTDNFLQATQHRSFLQTDERLFPVLQRQPK